MIKKSFTLLELLIVVAVISVLSAAVIILLNPLAMVYRANDIVRKKDLDDSKKILEQYMADTGCYPKPTQICAKNTTTGYCTFCANNSATQFSYFTKSICDPKRKSDYLYETDSTTLMGVTTVASCPKWFRIYSVLEGAYDKSTDIWGCGKGGCGIASQNRGYDYLVMSPGGPSDDLATTNFFCHTDTNACTQCTPFTDCIAPNLECYGKVIYSSRGQCCNLYPGSRNC